MGLIKIVDIQLECENDNFVLSHPIQYNSFTSRYQYKIIVNAIIWKINTILINWNIIQFTNLHTYNTHNMLLLSNQISRFVE